MSTPMIVTDNAVLADLCAGWINEPLLALDTEFVRETTFYPIPGLLQLGVNGGQYLIDPLTIDDWAPLRALFAAPMPKVLHACGEDLEVFERLLGCLPQPLLDSQVGAALGGWGYGLGYQALVAQLLDIHVDKEHTRSNWVARPLSDEQCRYAALDVAHLPQLYARIAERLEQLGRLAWWREEGERVITAARTVVEPAQYYRKLTAGFRLRGPQLAALRELCAWREQLARQLDTPRGRILKDAECLEIAKRLPQDINALKRIPDVDLRRVAARADDILEIVAQAQDSPEAHWPPAIEPPLPREWGGRLNRLRDLVAERARALGLPAELLARKRDCEYLLRTGELPEVLTGWRLAAVGADLQVMQKSFT
jgi:ribonuclease D